ncbi:MAG: bifunctional metallophosphatase/5'-nucleotidase, partial [Chloroflexota bacterium]
MNARLLRRAAPILLALAFLLSPLLSVSAAPRQTVDIQLLNVSDWHAQLDPNNGIGGAAVLSSYFKAGRLANPNTLTLTAGDAFGASPPLSNFFNEEPAVLAMNLMGFDADTFGNHNFDRGTAHLQTMIDLAEFQYVSANLKNVDDNLTGVAPYKIFTVGGVKVAVIGITNPEAPTLVFPGRFGTIEPTDPIPAANKAKAQAQAEGAKVIVAITHLGVTGFDASGAATGPLIDFANNVGGFDVIFGDHTDIQYSGFHNNALVVENRSKGATYSRSIITVDPENGRIVTRANTFVVPTASAVTPDPAIVAMLAPYRTALSAAFDGVIGV